MPRLVTKAGLDLFLSTYSLLDQELVPGQYWRPWKINVSAFLLELWVMVDIKACRLRPLFTNFSVLAQLSSQSGTVAPLCPSGVSVC